MKLSYGEVTDTTIMFMDVSNITSIEVNMYDTSKLTNMSSMFKGCSAITSLNIFSIDTSKVENMGGMLYECDELASLDLSKFDTSNVDDMFMMFCECNKLTSLDISSFNTAKVTDMDYFFSDLGRSTSSGCTVICPQGLDMSPVTTLDSMFSNAKLTHLVHLKNVPRGLIISGSSPDDWTLGGACDGNLGVDYIIDSDS